MDRKRDNPCYFVRKFVFPPSTDIAIIVVAVLVVAVNGFALISVLRNYRRLRQRIYVFVISLGVADILGGVVYLADALNRVIKSTREDVGIREYYLCKSGKSEEAQIIMLTRNVEDADNDEFIQGLKSGCIILSVLNTALVTFALYKRTTSMGKHHEDFRNLDGAMGADGNPFLPAFDTMMRVLSIGNPAMANGTNKNMGTKCGHIVQKNDDTRKNSNISRVSYSSTQPDEYGSGSRKPQVIKSSTENSTPRKGFNSNRNSSFSRLVHSGGRRMSHALRSRSVSGAPSYVGRHSNSVMSKAATRCSLFLVWLSFVAICVIPLALHRIGSSAFCSAGCHTTHIWKLRNESSSVQEIRKSAPSISNGTFTSGGTSLANYTTNMNSFCRLLEYNQVPAVNRHEESIKDVAFMPCSSCSSAFFPLSNSHQIFTVMIILINWIWLVTSSGRLLYLRKHSSNVFVRCSALWRFMFMMATVYFVTLTPLVVWMMVDFRTASSAKKSPLWYENGLEGSEDDPYGNVNVLDHVFSVVDKDSFRLHPYLGAIAVCFLLFHLAITPSLYLIRLLGFRRIFSIN